MMKKNFFTLTLLFILATSASAGYERGTVRFQHGQYGSSASSPGKMYFFLDGGTKTDSPACATHSGGERWVINNSHPAANMQLSILLAAHASDKEVIVRGSNNCAVGGDTETAVDIMPR